MCDADCISMIIDNDRLVLERVIASTRQKMYSMGLYPDMPESLTTAQALEIGHNVRSMLYWFTGISETSKNLTASIFGAAFHNVEWAKIGSRYADSVREMEGSF